MSTLALTPTPPEERATWTTAFINALPDSAFAVVEEGGTTKDGITHPLTLRHLPYKDADGTVDLPHLRNALARVSQSTLSAALKAKAQKVLDAAAKAAGVGAENRAVAASTPVAFYAPLTRIDAATREIEGVLSDEQIDSYGTIFDYDAMKRAVERWPGNIREQHDVKKAVGRRVAVRFDDAQRQVVLRARISRGAESTWQKIEDGVLTGFSIGTSRYAPPVSRTINNQVVPCYADFDLGEASVVDAPSNPGAASSGLTIYRMDAPGSDDFTDMDDDAPTETPPADAPAVTPDATPVERTAELVMPPAPDPAFQRIVGEMPAAGLLGAIAQPAVPESGASTSAIPAGGLLAAAAGQAAPTAGLLAAAVTPAPAAPLTRALPLPDTGGDTDPALLRDDGYTHTHDHAHATDYGDLHTHEHTHTHQDGTAHSHPHMHAHAHHDHYGDPLHEHEHTHTHDHAHTYRAAAPDVSQLDTPQPVARAITTESGLAGHDPNDAAPPAETAPTVAADGTHDAFTGTHTHRHSAFGSQGDDATHEHAHTHDGDATHDHDHAERAAASDPTTPVIRAGQRISGDTRAGLHEAALAILRTCACVACQEASEIFDPDNDGDDDLDAAGDTDQDAAGAPDRARQRRLVRRAAQGAITRALAPLATQYRALAARFAAAPDLTRVTAQLDEQRAVLTAVEDLVRRIATQERPGGPVLRAADRTLAVGPNAIHDASVAPQGQPLQPTDIAALQRMAQAGQLTPEQQSLLASALFRQQYGR